MLKSTKVTTLFFSLLFIIKFSYAQSGDIEFLITKIKNDYPGYATKVEKNDDFDRFTDKVVSKNKTDTFRILSEIVNYFQDQHLQVYQSGSSRILNDTLQYNKDLKMIDRYLNSTSQRRKKYEGYWINDYNDCVVGLKKESNNPLIYKGYLVEARDGILPIGFTLFTLELKKGKEYISDFTANESGGRGYMMANCRNDSTITTGAYGKWKKIEHYNTPILNSLPKYNYLSGSKYLDSHTYLFTIPGSTEDDLKIIDSIIKLDKNKILNAKTLIIDLRNNLGGTVRTFDALMPFICTGKIIRPQIAIYSTKAIIERRKKQLEDYIKNEKIDSLKLIEWQNQIAQQEDKIGGYVYLNPDTIQCDSIAHFPQNVAIIMNYSCQSAAEIMILNCKQSKKVKLFGEHTMGAVDYLDYYSVKLPSQKYKLFIPMTKRIIQKGEKPLDKAGILPDVPISDVVSNWVEFVRNYYEAN